ncbi:MAG TPA: response regulator [Terriglobales bacterium]|nr:response regulator [Terriglobales bacterium]
MNYTETTAPGLSALAISGALHRVQACKTILVVEDDAFVRQMIYEILEAANYRVLKCANATQAKVIFRQYGDIVDLLLVDVVLPGESGRELARDLMEVDSELKVLLVSGYAENLQLEEGTASNQVFCLPKPFSSESLVRKIWQVTSTIVGEVAI